MRTISYVFLLGSVLLISCGNSSRNNSEYVPSNDSPTTEMDEEDGRGGYDGYTTDVDEGGTSDIGNIRLTGEIVLCNKCKGYGMVQDGLYGQPQICNFCWISTQGLLILSILLIYNKI